MYISNVFVDSFFFLLLSFYTRNNIYNLIYFINHVLSHSFISIVNDKLKPPLFFLFFLRSKYTTLIM